jgi:hypothetical protein
LYEATALSLGWRAALPLRNQSLLLVCYQGKTVLRRHF